MNYDDLDPNNNNTPLKCDSNMTNSGKSPYGKNKAPLMNQVRRCCNCKQSRCVKLYCECFAAGVYCNPTCNCVDCWNNPRYEDHRKAAIKSTLEKNPAAFQPKISSLGNSVMESKLIDPGCACKKSSCLKKYCECFQAQIPCSDLCKCIDCHNTKAYHELDKDHSVGSDLIKPEELTDSNSFFCEPDSPGKPMKVSALNKKLNSSLNQETLERLYERLMRIINLPADEYLENEDYAREIDTYNRESILAAVKEKDTAKDTEIAKKETVEPNKKEDPNKMVPEASANTVVAEKKKEVNLGADQDDLICDEEVEDMEIKASEPLPDEEANASKEKPEKMDLETENEEINEDKLKELSREKKLSLYKIKKNRIIREFISVLRELDT